MLETTMEDYLKRNNEVYIDYINYIEEITRDKLEDVEVDVEALRNPFMQPEARERLEEVMTNWESEHSYVANVALPKLTEALKVVASNLPTTQLSVGLVDLITGLQADLNTDEFNNAVNKLSAVANVLEMGGLSYLIAKGVFRTETVYDSTKPYIDVTTYFPDFNAALTEFRTALNLFNTLSGSTQFYGPYYGRASMWEYSVTQRSVS